ncbi:protein RETARDED ROOT GROWTH-LIKE [Prosopis cineraria]|uniref:protein RETARDED ROOT GROWTH-LIKE n=1 Tax=Prosopis cineraria TaxID=364024 RepID=UPI00240EDBF8|nr:protein RETARDED ROOT GROWTH-LIKE [Prosopis cineraria]
MWRTLDAHLRTLRLPSSLSSSTLTSPYSSASFCTILSQSRRLKPQTLIPPKPQSSLSFLRSYVSFADTSVSPIPVTRNFGSGISLLVVRCVSSVSSVNNLTWNDSVSCSEVADGDDGGIAEDTKLHIPVKAYFFSTSVDLKSLVDQNKPNFVPPSSRMTNYVVFKFGNLLDSRVPGASCLSGSNCYYMVVFQYGSIVLFNVPENEVDGYLKIVERHASGLLPEMRKDEYEVREKPALSTWMQGGLDYITLQYLNVDGIRTIGSVLGQSIALDYYGRQVDGMVAEFTDINREMEMTGKFKMQRKKLFQLVGKANSNLADVILKLGLFERSDIAWKDAKYAQIWEYLRDEFELTQRFASLDFKLKFVEHNIRFLQEILQNRKSDFLEWLIIALIGVEILLSLYDIFHRSTQNL